MNKPRSQDVSNVVDRATTTCYDFQSRACGRAEEPRHSSKRSITGSNGPPESEGTLMQSDSKELQAHHVNWLWRETKGRLELLDKRAREGKQVDEASEFARWVRFSGLRYVFEAFDESSWRTLDKLVVQTLDDCAAYWKREPQGPWVSLSELEAVNQKLDRIAGELLRQRNNIPNNAPRETDTCYGGFVAEPALRAVPVGA